jgi:hypothetical protein
MTRHFATSPGRPVKDTSAFVPDRYRDLVAHADVRDPDQLDRYIEAMFKERGRDDRYCSWASMIGDHKNYAASLTFANMLKTDPDTFCRSQGAIIFSRLYLRGFRQAEKALEEYLTDRS